MAKKCKSSFESPIPWSNKNLQTIIDFYLMRCPVPQVCNRGKTFSQLGFSGTSDFSKLKKKLLSCSDTLGHHYWPSKRNVLEEKLSQSAILELPIEYCVFLSNEENTVMNSLFKAIRNSFAHSSFTVHSYGKMGRYYYLENTDGYKKAEMVLKETTLLQWINIVSEGNTNGTQSI